MVEWGKWGEWGEWGEWGVELESEEVGERGKERYE